VGGGFRSSKDIRRKAEVAKGSCYPVSIH